MWVWDGAKKWFSSCGQWKGALNVEEKEIEIQRKLVENDIVEISTIEYPLLTSI